MEQGKTHGAGAVKFEVRLHELFAEKVAETVQLAPLAFKPDKL
jgi:hypothetical protein